jgi:hypothetical protein
VVQDDVDLNELIQSRSQLTSLGVLINQSLRTSWGKSTDGVAMRELLKKLERILA